LWPIRPSTPSPKAATALRPKISRRAGCFS
jgi:hypothetical protein